MQSLLNNISKNLTLVNFSFRVNQSNCLAELPSAVEDIAEGGQVSSRSNRQAVGIENLCAPRFSPSILLPGDPGEVIQGVSGSCGSTSGSKMDLVNYSHSSKKTPNTQKNSGVYGAEPRSSHDSQHSGTPYKDILVVSAHAERDSKLKTSTAQCDNPDILQQDFNAQCASVVVGSCSSCGQHAIKVIYCGKEWCPHCGQAGSPTHNDRYAKYLSRARQMASMGYLVIEWPYRYRKIKNRVYSTKGLRKTTNIVVNVLAGRRMGGGRRGGYFSRGMIRWHWFGDKGRGWNPHMNILVDAGYLEPEKLEEIKAALRSALHCPDLIINYSFRQTPAEMAHTCRYVTRPTFHQREWDPHMAKELFETRNENDVIVAFRNSRTWGNWKQAQVWTTEGNEIYEKIDRLRNRNECPGCGKHMSWSDPLNKNYLRVVNDMGILKPIVRGYYEFKPDEYKGPFKGLDAVETLDTTTGELVPVNVNDPDRKNALNGGFYARELRIGMAIQRVKYLDELKAMEIDCNN